MRFYFQSLLPIRILKLNFFAQPQRIEATCSYWEPQKNRDIKYVKSQLLKCSAGLSGATIYILALSFFWQQNFSGFQHILSKKASRLFKYLSVSTSFVYLVYVCAKKNTGTPIMAKIPRISLIYHRYVAKKTQTHPLTIAKVVAFLNIRSLGDTSQNSLSLSKVTAHP